jgi:hypothetical protein
VKAARNELTAAHEALRELTGGPIVLRPRAGGLESHIPLLSAHKLLNGQATMGSGSGGLISPFPSLQRQARMK